MQCTSVYPAPPERANLRAMATMRTAFGVPVGLSDHTTGIAVPIAAAALGAAFVEKHFTLDRTMEGPDHPFALEPEELKAMVAGIREAQAALGDGRKDGPGPEEAKEMYGLARRSLIVVGDHPAGTVLSEEMLTRKRPGFGIAPKDLDKVVGRTAAGRRRARRRPHLGDALTGSDPTPPRTRLVADASAGAGLGHLARCTALACALSTKGFELETLGLGGEEAVELDGVHWAPWQPEAALVAAVTEPVPDLLVLDTYDRIAWQQVAELPHRLLVAFEDALPHPGAAGMVIGPQQDGGGLRFACLRQPFWEVGPRTIRESPERVLVTTGGGDLGGLAGRIATHLGERLPQVQIELVWGPGFVGEPPQNVTVLEQPPSLLEPLLRADAVVCAGGQTMLEAAATGTPAVVLEGAPNQRPQIASLASREAVLPVGEDEVPEALENLLRSASHRRELSGRAQEAVDGRGALRIASELAALAQR